MARREDQLTTGQVADLCGVAPKTVCHWIDSGLLKGWKLPGSTDRRTLMANLVLFMEHHGMDTSHMPRTSRVGVVVAVGFGADRLPADCGLEIHYAGTPFDAGVMFATQHPVAVLVDLAMGRIDATLIARSVRPDALCVAVGDGGVFDAFDAVIPVDLSPADKAERLRIVIEASGDAKVKKAS